MSETPTKTSEQASESGLSDVNIAPAWVIGQKVQVKKAGQWTVGVIDKIHENGKFDVTAEGCPLKNKDLGIPALYIHICLT